MRLKTFLSIISTAVLLVSVSCTKDPTEPQRVIPQETPEEDGYVTVSVGVSVEDEGIPTKSVITIADNDTPDIVAINDVRLGIYNADGSLFDDKYFTSGQDLKISLRKGDSYTIYTLVNMGPAISFPQNEDAIGDIYYSVSSLSDINTVGFPLHGPLEGTSITAGNDPKIRVTVRNLLSKITLSINRSALQTHNGSFTVKSLRLMNSPKGAYPLRSESKASSTTDVFTGDQATASDMAALNGGSEAVFYVFENMQGDLLSTSNRNSWNKIAPDAKKNVCTYIELIGEYTTDGGALKAENTYRMYLGENEYYNFDIKRNTKRWISVVLGDLGFQKGSWKVLSDVTSDDRSIVFDPTSMTLEEGDSRQYTVTVNPSGLLYDCTLSDNLKSLLGHNTSTRTLSLPTAPESDVYGTLTATTWDGRKSVTMDIIAKAKVVRTVESLTIDPSSKTIFVDGQFTITATAHFSDGGSEEVSCSWSSNHSNIASVDGGLVTGLSAGNATITASYGGKTASCSVTVKEVGVTQVYGKPVITVTYPDIPADGSGVYPTVHVSQSVTLRYEDSRPDADGEPVEYDITGPFGTTGDIFVKSFARTNGRSGTGSALSTSGSERGKASASSRGTTEGDRRAVEDVTVVVTANGVDSDAKKVTVYQEANVKTLSEPGSEETTDVELILTPSNITADGGTSTVTATRYYKVTTDKYEYTSGATSGGASTEHSESVTPTGVSVTPVSGTPTGKASASGNKITVQSNTTTSRRSWTVSGSYDGVNGSAILTQDGDVTYDYGDIIITIDPVDDIPASGGTSAVPSFTYSQTVTPSVGDPFVVTSGGTVYYGSTNNPTSTAASSAQITKTSLGTTVKSRTSVGTRYIKVTLNGKSAVKSFTVYQEANSRTTIPASSTTNYITVSLSPSSIGAGGGTSTVSATRNYDSVASGYSYTSGSTSGCAVTAGQTESISLTNVTLSPTGTATRSGSTITVPSNGSTSSRSWTVTGYYGDFSDYATLTQDGKSADVVTYSMSVSPDGSSVDVGSTLQLDATEYEYTNGVQTNKWGPSTMNSMCDWSSSNTSVATVSGSGLVTAKSTGTVTITAEYYENGYGNVSDDVTVYVVAASAPVVTYELEITPESTTLDEGESVSFVAKYYTVTDGVRNGGTTVTSSATWSIYSGSSYISSTTTKGKYSWKSGGGSATVKATYNGYTAYADITTNSYVPVVTTGHELELTGSDVEVTVGSTATVSRSARYYTITYHDGVEYDRTYTTVTATLSSSSTTVASVSGTTVTGKKVGTAYLTGTYNGYTSINSIEVDVVAPEPVVTYELEITPESTTLDEGESVSFVAKYYTVTDGVRNGGTTVTSSATWSIYSGSSYISSTTTKGKYTWKAAGSARVKATYNNCTAYADVTTNAAPEPEDDYEIVIEGN